MGRRKIKRKTGTLSIPARDVNLAMEIDYIKRRAALRDARFVTLGPLALFSTESGDAWLLDPGDGLAARLARDGDPEEIYIEETETRFAIGWKGTYRIDGDTLVYFDTELGRVAEITGYPPQFLRRIASK